jgi:hypothetical protein
MQAAGQVHHDAIVADRLPIDRLATDLAEDDRMYQITA